MSNFNSFDAFRDPEKDLFMSLREDLTETFNDIPEIRSWDVDSTEVHGEPATVVSVILLGGKFVRGMFTNEPKDAFGGVEFSGRKDIPKLMKSKIEAVLNGTAEEVRP